MFVASAILSDLTPKALYPLARCRRVAAHAWIIDVVNRTLKAFHKGSRELCNPFRVVVLLC